MRVENESDFARHAVGVCLSFGGIFMSGEHNAGVYE